MVNRIISFAFFLSFLLIANGCSMEREVIRLDGDWNATYFERVNCVDSLDNIMVDFSKDSLYIIDSQEVRFNSFVMSFYNNDNYVFTSVRTVNGQEVTETESGTFLSAGFNDIFFCVGPCRDSLLKTGVYVVDTTMLDISWIDTIQQGCSFFINAESF